MRKMIVSVALALLAGWAFADAPPPIVNGGGMVLKDLVGKDRIVTVVLKGSNALDCNLHVVDIGPATFSVISAKGERTAYLFSSVAEIRVQDGQVESHEFNLDANRALRPEEQKIVDRALERCRELFDAPNSNQAIKMRAATFLSASGKKDSNEYLHKLVSSNDLPTEVEASLCLYIAGDNEIGKTVVPQGLKSGDRAVRAKASLLAGLTGDQSAAPVLEIMVRDRAKEICAPAARALGLLGVRNVIPDLFKMIQVIEPVKGDAAVFALTRLGGPDVIDQAKELLAHAEGLVRYRLVLLLYHLNDPTGKDLMVKEMLASPTLQPETAPILARDGNREAVQYLAGRLQALYDEKPDVLLFRAKAAIALMYTVDPTAVSHLQKLLTVNHAGVRMEISNLIAETGKRKLLPILQPLIEDARPGVSMAACGAVLAIARPDFQARFVATLEK
ncbi:MAG: hypothetical protein NTU83_11840 [Candidatus Hydrogenedentes bacterium]|nr:hypothetical protein [Candidatus Hydrogenedentota bacterium]